jgi:hypothetical protein
MNSDGTTQEKQGQAIDKDQQRISKCEVHFHRGFQDWCHVCVDAMRLSSRRSYRGMTKMVASTSWAGVDDELRVLLNRP